MKKLHAILLLVGLFAISRVYIFNFPPVHFDKEKGGVVGYSDVKADYERYANMWEYGLPPYLKQFFEYPPAAVPLLWSPLKLDIAGIGSYYQNFRTQILIFDGLLFASMLWFFYKKTKFHQLKWFFQLGFYIVAGAVAKDFWYEGLDLIFIGSLSMALIFGELLSERKTWGRVVFWSFFWLSTAIKFMSIPLMVLYFYLKKISFRKELTAYIIGFLLIWSVPLAIFRSSLSVSFVFHLVRHVKYASFPSYIVQTINTFTHTESQLDKAPDFPWLGPVNDIVEPIFGVVYPLSLLLVLGLGTVLILRLPTANLSFWVNFNKLKNTLRQLFFRKKISLKHLEVFEFQIGITLIYFLTQFVTGKIFSQPFHIWLVPLVTLFPYKNYNLMAKFMLLTLALLVLDTTGWLHPVYEPIKNEPVFHIAYGAVRFGLIFYMLFEAIKVVGERTKPKSQA